MTSELYRRLAEVSLVASQETVAAGETLYAAILQVLSASLGDAMPTDEDRAACSAAEAAYLEEFRGFRDSAIKDLA